MRVQKLTRFNFLLGVLLLGFIPLAYSTGLRGIFNSCVLTKYFLFDSLSFYLILLVFFLGVFSVFLLKTYLDTQTVLLLSTRLLFTILCFCVNHSIIFWCFYELAMLPLLYLIFRDSPYSERFIAGWYFSVYLLVTSLPLVLILLYLSYVNGSLFFSSWSYGEGSLSAYVLLSFVFFTKIPLAPFHTWLPIVHAEATSIVSIFLSGYIMKLGLLGVYRCSSFIFNSEFVRYLFACCCLRIFFTITASGELDGKRWLAFLRLSHIVVAFLGFFVCDWSSISLVFLFCLGHGLSAGLVFGCLWFFYKRTRTRKWLLLKTGVSGVTVMGVLVLSSLSLCSFPPTIQFFCEIGLLTSSTTSWFYILFWCFYLFFGGLVPLVLCGHLLVRCESVETRTYSLFNFLVYFVLLCAWCYMGVFMI